MSMNIKPENRRLLESLEHIDEKLVLEALGDLKDTSPKESAKPFGHWKRIAAMAACLVLLSCAIPLISYILPRLGVVFGGNAGSDEYSDYDPYTDSAVFDYPVDMPAEEIYADVLLGGWCVWSVKNFDSVKRLDAGAELWDEFYQKVRNKEPAVYRTAFYIEENNSDALLPEEVTEPDGNPCIQLTEIFYDGEKFYYSDRNMLPSYSFDFVEVKEYLYLKLSKKMNKHDRQFYFLTNDPKLEWWSSFISSSRPDYEEIYTP